MDNKFRCRGLRFIFIIFIIQLLNYIQSEPLSKKEKNRDEEQISINTSNITSEDSHQKPSVVELISNAHEVLRVALRQFLNMRDAHLEEYLKEITSQNEAFFVDEFGEIITSYKKVFSFILEQVKELEIGNYAVKQFAKDRHDLCSVARYLSHQVLYAERKSIIQRIGDALGDPCNPCTAYKRLQHANDVVINTNDEKRHKCRYHKNTNNQTSSVDSSRLNSTSMSVTSTGSSTVIISESIETNMANTPQSTSEANSIITTTLTSSTTSRPATISTKVTTTNMNKPGQEFLNIDFTPCSHRLKSGSLVEINCEFTSVFEVFTAFRRSLSNHVSVSKDIDKFTYTLKSPLSSSVDRKFVELPEDLINNYHIKSIRIYCPESDGSTHASRIPLKIDMNAFRSSRNSTTEIVFRGCHLGHLDFSFLSGFDQLKTFSVDRATDLHKSFVTLPQLKSLNRLSLRACTEQDVSSVNVWNTFPPPLIRGITELCLSFHDNFDDSILSRILDWILLSSGDTLREFDIFQNKKMTTIPPQVKEFKKLVYFSASHNGLPLSLFEDSLHFGGLVENIHLTSSQIGNILPGTFKGDFTRTEMIDLSNNKLTRFESSAFLPLLEQMSENGGKLRLDRNPMDCETDPCHLAWLIRDRRHLLENVLNAKCSYNGTSFENIDENDDNYIHCPET